MVTRQLQVERAGTGKNSPADVLPLCHATNPTNQFNDIKEHVGVRGCRSGDGANGVEQRSAAADADAGAAGTHGPADHRRERNTDQRHPVVAAARHHGAAAHGRILRKSFRVLYILSLASLRGRCVDCRIALIGCVRG